VPGRVKGRRGIGSAWGSAAGAVIAAALAASCGSGVRSTASATPVIPVPAGAVLLRSTPTPPPEWITKEPAPRDGLLFFGGISGKTAVQRDARDEAEKNGRARVAEYVGSRITERWERIVADHGLASEVRDASVAQRGLTTMASEAVVSRYRIQEWYIEEYGTPAGGVQHYIVQGMGSVPEAAVDKAIAAAAEELKRCGAVRGEVERVVAEAQRLEGTARTDHANGFSQRAAEGYQQAVTALDQLGPRAERCGMSDEVKRIGDLKARVADARAEALRFVETHGPDWVRKGGDPLFGDTSKAICGVGSAKDAGNLQFQRTRADMAARRSLAANLRTISEALTTEYLQQHPAAGGASVAETASMSASSFVSSTLIGARVVEYWTDPATSEMYALVRMDAGDSLMKAYALALGGATGSSSTPTAADARSLWDRAAAVLSRPPR